MASKCLFAQSTALSLLLFLSLFTRSVSSLNARRDDFVSFNIGVFQPESDVAATLAPRWYMRASPVLPAIVDKRQDENGTTDVLSCPPGKHSCAELPFLKGGNICCDNSQYCFLSAEQEPQCCALGSSCADANPCGEDRLYCYATAQVTNTGSTTFTTATTITADESTITAIATVTEPVNLVEATDIPACCARPCSSSHFQCQSVFGGQCCPYGFRCGVESQCIYDPTPTSSIPTIVTPVPPGCTTSQFACDDSEGGGCCNFGQTCTSQLITVSGQATPSLACALDEAAFPTSSGGLSPGAKAGIGVGVTVGSAIVIAAFTWLCIRRRREKSGSQADEAAGRGIAGGGGAWGGRGTPYSLSRGGRRGTQGDVSQALMSPYPQGHAMSETSGIVSARPQLHIDGLTRDYFGPDAIVGPYTEFDDGSNNPIMSPNAVPVGTPNGPEDIRGVIEIDSRMKEEGVPVGLDNKDQVAQREEQVQEDEDEMDRDGPYELSAEASPLSPDEVASQPRSMIPSPIPGMEVMSTRSVRSR